MILQFPLDEGSRELRERENAVISNRLKNALGPDNTTWLLGNRWGQITDYPELCKLPTYQEMVRDVLPLIDHPNNLEWLARSLPTESTMDCGFLMDLVQRTPYSLVISMVGEFISRAKHARNVADTVRYVLTSDRFDRERMFYVLAAPIHLPAEEARRHILRFIDTGPGVAAEAIRKVAQPEDLETFRGLLAQKLDSWDKGRIETTVRQLEKKFAKSG